MFFWPWIERYRRDSVVQKTASYTLTLNDCVVEFTVSTALGGDAVATLPPPSECPGMTFFIVLKSTANSKQITFGAPNADNKTPTEALTALTVAGTGRAFISDGLRWYSYLSVA